MDNKKNLFKKAADMKIGHLLLDFYPLTLPIKNLLKHLFNSCTSLLESLKKNNATA